MDKPFRTHNELICIMNARGLKTDNRTKFILEREGYYAVVNGYKDLFIDSDAKQSAKGEVRYKDGNIFRFCLRKERLVARKGQMAEELAPIVKHPRRFGTFR